MKLLTATMFVLAALGVAPLAQAGIGVPQGPSAHAATPPGPGAVDTPPGPSATFPPGPSLIVVC